MKVAVFDIDDTVVEETEFMLKNAQDFLEEKYGIEISVSNSKGYDIKEVFGLVNYFKELGLREELAIQRSNEINQDFWNTYFIKYCKEPLKKGVKETVDLLRENGYKVMFVSLRGKTTSKNPTIMDKFIRLKVIPYLTSSQLSKGKVEYDNLKLVRTPQEKIDFINNMNPDYVFEDQPNILNQINSKSKIFCVTTPHNERAQLPDGVIRLDEFDNGQLEEIILQDCLEEESKGVGRRNPIKKISFKKPEYLRKILTESAYSLVRKVGKPIAYCKYHPIVKGQENIPQDCGVSFVGNHRNKLDPVIVGVTANRNIHWGALLRMFQGKEDLFSSSKGSIPCNLSAAFITAVGAVPIARETDENCRRINIESLKTLSQLLRWEGAIGLFPEGTLNRKPDEQNILPLKSDSIFKMTAKADGLVQPFSIVWVPEDIDVKNRVIITYGTPINSRNRTPAELSHMWHDSVNSSIEESKKLIEGMSQIDSSDIDKKTKSEKMKVLVKEFVNK